MLTKSGLTGAVKATHLGQKQRGMALSNYTRVDEGTKHAHLPFYQTRDSMCAHAHLQYDLETDPFIHAP